MIFQFFVFFFVVTRCFRWSSNIFTANISTLAGEAKSCMWLMSNSKFNNVQVKVIEDMAPESAYCRKGNLPLELILEENYVKSTCSVWKIQIIYWNEVTVN